MQRYLHAELLENAREEAQRHQGVAAHLEEILVPADRGPAQHGAPDRADLSFDRGFVDVAGRSAHRREGGRDRRRRQVAGDRSVVEAVNPASRRGRAFERLSRLGHRSRTVAGLVAQLRERRRRADRRGRSGEQLAACRREGLEEHAVRRILRGGHEGVHDEAILVEPGDHRARRSVVAEAITDAYDERLEARTRHSGDLALRATAARGVELVGPVEQLRDARDVAFERRAEITGSAARCEFNGSVGPWNTLRLRTLSCMSAAGVAGPDPSTNCDRRERPCPDRVTGRDRNGPALRSLARCVRTRRETDPKGFSRCPPGRRSD